MSLVLFQHHPSAEPAEGHKFRSDVNWQWLLKQKCVKHMIVKQWLSAFLFLEQRGKESDVSN